MPEVTINSADLEALLFAAGAANASPEAKKILKRDPQFEQVEGRLPDAVKRAGDSWRKASRAEQFPERFQVNEQDVAYLRGLAKRGAGLRFGMVEPLDDQVDRSFIARLLVEYGIYSEHVVWSSSGQQDQMTHAPRRVRLTNDGRAIIERYAREALAQPDPALNRGIGRAVLPAEEVAKLADGNTHGGARALGQYGDHDFDENDKCTKCQAPRVHVEDGLIGPKCSGIVVIKPRVHETDAGVALDLSESFPKIEGTTNWPIAGRTDD